MPVDDFSGAVALPKMRHRRLCAYQGLQSYQQRNVRGWLMRIAKNACIDIGERRRKANRPMLLPLICQSRLKLDHRAEAMWELAKVQDEMKMLPDEQRRCLEMKMEGYSYEETAQSTGLSLDAVKSHLQNGRRMLWLRVQGFLSELP